ncbi:helix-turn-helix transcriptional regulator, partial [Vagococcus fluvialis]
MNQIKKYRKMSGISQTELAKRIKVARQTINLIEND